MATSNAITKPNRKVTLSNGTSYTYIAIHPSKANIPTILFLHGFPSTAYDWRNQVSYFSSLGYGIIAPDLLGYGGSSKPSSPSAYIGSKMSADIISILDEEKIVEEIVGVAHDWGVFLLSQLAIHHGHRFQKYVFTSTAFMRPLPDGTPFTHHVLREINQATNKTLGYSIFGYWEFFNEEDAGKVIGEHWESFYKIIYVDCEEWKTHLGPVGALKKFIASDSKSAKPSTYVTDKDKEYHHEQFGFNYTGPLNWYKRAIASLGDKEEERAIVNGDVEGWNIGKKLDKKALLIVGAKDPVALPASAIESMEQSLEVGFLEVAAIDAGHWVQLEKAQEYNQALQKFLEDSIGS